MDFHTLNRRQLQSLCKLNNIPANITNVAMAEALGSLKTVEGIEEILNSSRSETAGSSVESPEKIEVTSPRAPRTSYRTSTRQKAKKTDVDYLPVTVSRTTSRGVRRQLAGEANEFMKTPMVSCTRKKAPTTVQKETTVQSVYNTRRSARLAEKKCAGAVVIGRETSQPVKIDSFLEEVDATLDKGLAKFVSENSVESGSGSMEASHESTVSSENTEDKVAEESVESCDAGVSKEKVEDICNAFEKLDVVVVDGTDQNLMAEKAQHVATTLENAEKTDNSEVVSVELLEQHENIELNETQNDAEKFVVNEVDTSEVKNDLDELKPDSKSISSPCGEGESEESFVVVNEKNDCNEALNGSVEEHNVRLQVDNLKPDSKVISHPLEDENNEDNLMVTDEKIDTSDEALSVSVKEHNVYLQVDNLKPNSEGICSPCVDEEFEDSSVVVGEKNDISEAVNDSVKKQNVYFQVRNPKADSRGIFNACMDVDSEENVGVVSEKNDISEALNETVKEQNVYLQVETVKADSEVISNLCEAVEFEENLEVNEKNDTRISEALNDSVKEQNDYSQVDNPKAGAEVISKLCEDADFKEVLEAVEKNDFKEGLNIPVMEQDVHSHEGILNSDSEDVFDPSEYGDSAEDVSDLIEDGDSEEEWTVNEKTDVDEASSVSVEEQNSLPSEEDSDSFLSDRTIFVSEIDGSDADPFSSDTENPNDYTGLKLEDMLTADSKIINEDSECNGSPNMAGDIIYFNTVNPFELSELESSDNHYAAKELNAEVIEENISTVIGSPNMMRNFVHFNNENPSEVSGLASFDNHIAAKILNAEGIYAKISENTGSLNMGEDLIHSKTDNRSELSELESPDNYTVVIERTADCTDDNISKYTVEMLLVNANELETGMDFSAIEEAQVSLIDETAVNQELDLNYEQVGANKHEPGVEFAAHEEAQESLISETAVKREPDLNFEKVNQEAVQIISDGDKIPHESVVDVSDIKENQFSTKGNDDIDHPNSLTPMKKQVLSDSPAVITGLTQVSGDNDNSGRKLQGVIGEEDKSINANAVDEKPMRHGISIRQLKKQLKKLSIKNNSDSNKDDKVVEARSALQAKCDNQLATTETDN
ncbi:hypothetical protein Tco_0675810 [Tanacetum coccineum]